MKSLNHFSFCALFSGSRGRRISIVSAMVLIAVAALGFRGGRLSFTAAPVQAQTSGSLKISFRDSLTGYAVPTLFASEKQKEGARNVLVTDAAGRGLYQLAAGRHDIEVAPGGYRPMKTHFAVDPQTPLAVTVWLDPLEPPEELRPEVIRAKLRPGYTMLHGHVSDVQAGRPLAKVRIRLEQSGVETQTDERGYFLLYAPAPHINPTEELPKTDSLVAEVGGFETYRLTNILLTKGASHFKLDLERGEGVIERDKGHKMLHTAEELKNSQEPLLESATGNNYSRQPETPPLETRSAETPTLSMNVSVPTSIRVGFTCSCATCSTVQVYSLDTYTRLGLDDEWISSWNSNSLKAGAIAYRSYGAYHVYHPRDANYDICSTTCCQVIDPNDSSSNTDNATAATTEVIVVNASGTEPLFAEYAAENNDTYCADGFTGRPADNWPCINDLVDAGQTFNGHGRGMCQWGTQRWAINQAKDWIWIVNHYYNDNGFPSGARSGVLQTPVPEFSLSATPSSQTVAPGAGTSYTVTVVPTNGFSGIVDFSASGLPSGTNAGFNPTPVDTSGSTTMTVTTSVSTTPGTYSLTVTGSSGALIRTTTATLVVVPTTTDWFSPTANAAVTSGAGDNNGYEVNAANAGADDNLFAVDNNSGSNNTNSCTDAGKDRHRFFNYGISIPAGSTIWGIEVRLQAKVDSTAGSPHICVELSWDGGTTWTTTKSTATLSNTELTYILGGVADTWGRTWTIGELSDGNFRVRITDVASNAKRDFSLDWVAVRVSY